MPYRFAVEDQDYSDYASGRVFYSAPGHPAFPVRLISEVFQRCQALRRNQGLTGPVNLYDPCCGSAYHLSTLAYLHWSEIKTIIGSDIDEEILPTAARNLALLTPEGLEKRAQEIAELFAQYGKASHAEAGKSVQSFKERLNELHPIHPIKTQLFTADATDSQQLLNGLAGQAVDLVLADVPYGQLSKWQTANPETLTNQENLLEPMLETLLAIVSTKTIVAIISDKAQKHAFQDYQRLGQFQIGKRQVVLLQAKDSSREKSLRPISKAG